MPVLIVMCLVLAAPVAAAPVAGPGGARPPAAGSGYIVVLHDDADRRQVLADYADALRARRRYSGVFSGFAGLMTPEAAAALAVDPRVAAVEADGWMQRAGAQASPPWGLDRIDQPGPDLDQTYAYNSSGRGVAVYVVDGGVYGGHRGFGGRVRAGFDVTGRGARSDCDGHGTHIAGTVGGSRFGVAKKVSIVPVRVADCSDYIRRSDVVAGLDYIVRHHRRGSPAVVNISLGGPASKVADRAVNRVIDDGVTVVAAAGNEGADACSTSPARVPRVITVGAVNRNDWSPFWSNYGSCVDLFAPGVDVKSAGIAGPTATRTKSGTSMAAPHVAGVASRFLSSHRAATPGEVSRHLLANAMAGARNTGPATTSKMVFVPGKVPTAVAAWTNRARVDPDDPVTVRARLQNTATWAGTRGAVTLLSRPLGSRTWRTLEKDWTDTTGRAAFTHTPGRAMEYRWVHAGSARTKPSSSPIAELGYRKWTTTLEFLTDLGLEGRFTADGWARSGYKVVLYVRTSAAAAWERLDVQHTNGFGRVDFSDSELPGLQYQMRHPGTQKTRRVISETYSS